ncbi:cytochrome c oxidase assembly protein COX16 homolog, mitochondrial [Cimex lectularius]|uniref:Cytochrome c oxidase assembly protein COX16 homolog, mitochondrial n=1 Tax=Cimex lectularius TaxID=79782 RepID=A0A8I6RLN3_CIMLE|nr:cytochrome c oxidase assembly protein COX16 homolog, mitochondrial [Cimex lectularius]
MAQLSALNSRFVKFGIPFVIFIVGGSFGLKEFTQIRYAYGKNKLLDPDTLKEYGIDMKKPGEVTLESEYEKIKGLANQEWENIRGPRPWEPDTLTEKK